ncbi:MAG: TetR/AcrR family transcriptional regulator [Candidatus Hydrogenedentes bacterium]|nr:TetR/AcrR family transcriptional regulator [Candidatus Hydrogenedentota bacterium]
MATVAPAPKTVNEAESKLLESALTLFSEKGYEGTSIREIIEGAGVTRPVLYYYFENKEDLFRRLVEIKFTEFTNQIEAIKSSVPTCADRLKAIIRKEFVIAERSPETVRLILQVFFSLPQQGPRLDKTRLAHARFRLLEDIMRDGLERNELSGGDAQSLALVFLGIMDMHIMAKSNRPETRLTPDLADGLVDLFLAGAGFREAPVTALVSPYTFG